MSKEKRLIEKNDLVPSDVYANSRKQIRKNLVEFKKARFESHDKNYAREEIPDAHIRGFFEFQNNSKLQ